MATHTQNFICSFRPLRQSFPVPLKHPTTPSHSCFPLQLQTLTNCQAKPAWWRCNKNATQFRFWQFPHKLQCPQRKLAIKMAINRLLTTGFHSVSSKLKYWNKKQLHIYSKLETLNLFLIQSCLKLSMQLTLSSLNLNVVWTNWKQVPLRIRLSSFLLFLVFWSVYLLMGSTSFLWTQTANSLRHSNVYKCNTYFLAKNIYSFTKKKYDCLFEVKKQQKFSKLINFNLTASSGKLDRTN